MAKKIVKVKVLKAHYQGARVCKPGEIISIPENLAQEVVWMKKAELYVEKPKPETETKDSVAEAQDTEKPPTKKGSAKKGDT